MRKLMAGLVTALSIAACGGGSGAPASPSSSSGGGATVTITTSGVSPKTITIAAGAQVTFVNDDTQNHQIYSNPHPDHTDCPEINQVGFLAPGQSRQTGNLNIVRSCGYHDHDLPTDTRWQGTIVIH